MRLLLLLVILNIPVVVLAQSAVSIENGEVYNPKMTAHFLHDLYKANDYVISFRTTYPDKSGDESDYFILTRSGDKLFAYNYLQKKRSLIPLSLSHTQLELAWRTFLQNDMFTMRNEKDIPNFCLDKYQIYNSHTYEFVLLSRGKMKKLSFYSPEYYDVACYGMDERRKIINSVAVINHVLSE